MKDGATYWRGGPQSSHFCEVCNLFSNLQTSQLRGKGDVDVSPPGPTPQDAPKERPYVVDNQFYMIVL